MPRALQGLDQRCQLLGRVRRRCLLRHALRARTCVAVWPTAAASRAVCALPARRPHHPHWRLVRGVEGAAGLAGAIGAGCAARRPRERAVLLQSAAHSPRVRPALNCKGAAALQQGRCCIDGQHRSAGAGAPRLAAPRPLVCRAAPAGRARSRAARPGETPEGRAGRAVRAALKRGATRRCPGTCPPHHTQSSAQH